jgi:hypothetical protein
MDKRIQKMVRYTRAHGSKGERLFTKQFIMPYAPTIFTDPTNGEILCYVVDVADKTGVTPPVLFSSHVDTVHNIKDPVYQVVTADEGCGLLFKEDDMPLGADCAAGVWVMLHMIDHKVPGTYVFHRGEERGGIGSQGMVAHYEHFLRMFEHAIAFDRRGENDVITHQAGRRCCSDEFAGALAMALNNLNGFDYARDDSGVFTDTANYMDIIPECTNISVGYHHEHSKNEYLDVWHMEKLANRLVEVFGTGIDLPLVRNPNDVEYNDAFGSLWRDRFTLGSDLRAPVDATDVIEMPFKDLVKWVRDAEPTDVADFICALAEHAYDTTYDPRRDEALQ